MTCVPFAGLLPNQPLLAVQPLPSELHVSVVLSPTWIAGWLAVSVTLTEGTGGGVDPGGGSPPPPLPPSPPPPPPQADSAHNPTRLTCLRSRTSIRVLFL